MHDGSHAALQKLRSTLRDRWRELLYAAPITSPLGTPDALVHMMDWTLDRIFEQMGAKPRKAKKATGSPTTHWSELCECGLNPLLSYFRTAERAFSDTLQSTKGLTILGGSEKRDQILADAQQAVRTIARAEVETLCSLCQRKHCLELATESDASVRAGTGVQTIAVS